jgi:acyl-CoA thioester hydrolase
VRHRPEPVDVSLIGFWVPVEVRYSDLDAQGHVNNATYFTYFEQARVQYFHALRVHALALQTEESGREPDPKAAGLPFVIASADCYYRRPISALAPVSVGVRAARVTHTSIEMVYAVCAAPGGEVHATGSTLTVSVDLLSLKPRALPAWARYALDAVSTEHTAHGTETS